jgi:hypothetical protein
MAATKFNVVLDLELTKTQIATIQKKINTAVAKSLLEINIKKPGIWGSRIPSKEWLGKWLKYFNSLEDLKKSSGFTQTRLQ